MAAPCILRLSDGVSADGRPFVFDSKYSSLLYICDNKSTGWRSLKAKSANALKKDDVILDKRHDFMCISDCGKYLACAAIVPLGSTYYQDDHESGAATGTDSLQAAHKFSLYRISTDRRRPADKPHNFSVNVMFAYDLDPFLRTTVHPDDYLADMCWLSPENPLLKLSLDSQNVYVLDPVSRIARHVSDFVPHKRLQNIPYLYIVFS